jgi:hypothetical protein
MEIKMTTQISNKSKWLLLIHQIPPKPNALRVRIWRRLQQVGAVAIKPSVYVIPLSEQSREDFSWTLKEIIDGGGDGSISEARFVEGLTDEQIITLFQNARKSEYEKIIQETRNLLADWSSEQNHSIDPAVKGPVQLSKMQRRVDEIAAIDFFQTPERATAEILLKELEKILSGYPIEGKTLEKVHSDLKGKIWVTRENLFVDRIACGWLIRKFIDQEAVFKFVSEPQYSPKPDEILFDMFDGEYTHEGDRCTFEVMIQRLQPKDNALGSLGKVVHDIDLKDGKYARSETDGFNALLTGLVAAYSDDDQRMTEGYRLFDNLYTYYQRQKKE